MRALSLVIPWIVAAAGAVAFAQDPVQESPNVYKVLLDNDRVRVLDVHLRPGQKSPMHSHPAFIIYSFNASKVKFTTPDGKSTVMELKPGQTAWSDGVSHAAENVGKTEAHALNIELKK